VGSLSPKNAGANFTGKKRDPRLTIRQLAECRKYGKCSGKWWKRTDTYIKVRNIRALHMKCQFCINDFQVIVGKTKYSKRFSNVFFFSIIRVLFRMRNYLFHIFISNRNEKCSLKKYVFSSSYSKKILCIFICIFFYVNMTVFFFL